MSACTATDVTECDDSDYGDGFSHLTPATAVPIGNSVLNRAGGRSFYPGAKLPWALPVSSDALDGSSIWLLKHMAQQASFEVHFEILVFNSSTAAAERAAQVLAAFDLGYDCVVSSVIQSFERMPYLNFLQPHQPFGFVVMSR